MTASGGNSHTGAQCFAAYCNNYTLKKPKDVTFHRFPDKSKSREQWSRWACACHRVDREPSKWSLLCSTHFEESMFDRTGQTVRLRSGAVPTIFNFPAHLQLLQKKVTPRQTQTSGAAEEPLKEVARTLNEKPSEFVAMDHPYTTSPESFKRKCLEAEARLEELRKKIKNIQRREQRARTTLKAVSQDLYNKNLINCELQAKLKAYGVNKTKRKVAESQDKCQ